MFIHVSALLVPILALFSLFVTVGSTPVAVRGGSCSGASPQCCQQTAASTSTNAQKYGISNPIQGGDFGLQCTSFIFGGIPNGANCDGSVLCCQKTGVGNNSSVAMGCMPVGIQM
ncbi:hypothetical protein SCLCIDRAFT_1216013 [Scleroderma citrinum Foug A]|uniref:Hydrophobin n=1 Tax=Scleroderma citrinum Foug A TaxID=1036808 RepID=A0A0C3DZ89_9AGAM|nr:hypothetical protein SCLCIDRAFT_1216013 [Scleroderma citrinum Foug A]